MITKFKKLLSGIAGFDIIAHGGIPEGRTTLVSGTSGSGKTVFAVQYLYKLLNRRITFYTIIYFNQYSTKTTRRLISIDQKQLIILNFISPPPPPVFKYNRLNTSLLSILLLFNSFHKELFQHQEIFYNYYKSSVQIFKNE